VVAIAACPADSASDRKKSAGAWCAVPETAMVRSDDGRAGGKRRGRAGRSQVGRRRAWHDRAPVPPAATAAASFDG